MAKAAPGAGGRARPNSAPVNQTAICTEPLGIMQQKPMRPKELVKKWVHHFNEGDADSIAELYHEDAINHQVANHPVEGKENILAMFRSEFNAADMVCVVENIFEDGEWAILEWKDPKGLRGCGFFHVLDSRIKFQRGYWDKLSFLRMNDLPLPQE